MKKHNMNKCTTTYCILTTNGKMHVTRLCNIMTLSDMAVRTAMHRYMYLSWNVRPN